MLLDYSFLEGLILNINYDSIKFKRHYLTKSQEIILGIFFLKVLRYYLVT